MLADFPGMNPAPLGYGARLPFYEVRDKFDRVLQANKMYPLKPQEGETPELYERRLTRELMPHATSYAPMKLDKIPADIFRDIEKTVVKEAMQAPARRGELVPVRFKDRVGREVTEFEGRMSCWLGQFRGPCLATGVCLDGVPQRF
ncbi:hypothetical protein PQR75_06540 [Paraburkholderia fungorum]|uniref:hypothetical protein n=1 Tax=Paraburkholderia fungorum TaxID=134537 RepID=UPI0038B9C14F